MNAIVEKVGYLKWFTPVLRTGMAKQLIEEKVREELISEFLFCQFRRHR